MSPQDLVFIGFNSQVIALDRDSGELAWSWQAPKPKRGGYVTLLLDDDRLIVSVNGYMYCLLPRTGEQIWSNELKGFGTGVASIASVRGHSLHHLAAIAAAQAEQAAANAAASNASVTP